MARDLKFRIYEVERLYYPCSENKDADQLRGYREADLRLCFRIYAKIRFSHNAAQMIYRMSPNFVLKQGHKNVRMTSVLFKMVGVHTGNLR